MKFIPIIFLTLLLFSGHAAWAQTEQSTTSTSTAGASLEDKNSPTTTANLLREKTDQIPTQDKTQPEELSEKVAIFSLFEARPVTNPNPFNFMAYWVQQAVSLGIPANTIFLILLTPILALMVSFVRVVIGLTTLDMLVPIALAFVFVAIGVAIGVMILITIFLASYLSKMLLKKMRIMFYPKRSLSILFLSIFVFAALTVSLFFDLDRILSVSIFPILILMLLGDSIVSVQLTKSMSETLTITTTTILLGLAGYMLAVSEAVRDMLILYPEIVLLTIPLNLLIGRYFGLRLMEYFRFNNLSD